MLTVRSGATKKNAMHDLKIQMQVGIYPTRTASFVPTYPHIYVEAK